MEWSHCLAGLIDDSRIDGCAALDSNGAFLFGHGQLANESAVPSRRVLGYFNLKAFDSSISQYGAATSAATVTVSEGDGEKLRKDDESTSLGFEYLGMRLIPIFHSLKSVYATSKYRRVTLIICRVPFGFVLGTSRRPNTPQDAASAVESFVDSFRA